MKVVVVDLFSSGLSLVEAFRERGIEPFRVYQEQLAGAYQRDPAPAGKLRHESVDTTCAALKRYGAEAVVAGSETGVALADKLAEARALAAAGVPGARTEAVSDLAELARVIDLFDSYPVVVKPTASAGSDGVAVCATLAELRRAVGGLLGKRNAVGSVNDSVLVQEHLDGPQYTLNTVTVAGRHVLNDVSVSRFDEVNGSPILRHKISRRELDDTDRPVVEYGLHCLDAVGLTNGAGHTEIRLTDRGPRLVEVNFRLMGPMLPSDFYVATFGYSHATLFAEAVLGTAGYRKRAATLYVPARRYMGMVMLRACGTGPVRAMPGLDDIRRLDTFHSFANLPRLGAPIANPLMTTGGAGVAFFAGPDPDAILADLNRVHDLEDAGLVYSMAD